MLLLSSITGLANTVVNTLIIYATKLNQQSGGSPGAMNSILMFNVVVLLIFGIILFNEHHTCRQYAGAAIIFLAIIVLTVSRSFEKTDTHTGQQNNQYLFSVGIIFSAACVNSIPGVAGKYAMYFHNCDPINYSIQVLLVSGLSGSAIYLYIYAFQVPFGLAESQSVFFAIMSSTIWGILSTIGYIVYYVAASKGPVEIVQLLWNMKIIVQIVEEFIFLGILPTILSFISIALGLFGLVLIIFSKVAHREVSDVTSTNIEMT